MACTGIGSAPVCASSAGLWTTPTDLARVGIELLRVLDQKAPSLLEKEIVDEILSPQLPGQSEGEGEYFGLGFFCKGSGDSFHFEHSGWNEGFLALISRSLFRRKR